MPKVRKAETLTLGRVLGFVLSLPFLAAWVQHFYTCVMTARWVLLIAGAIVAPIGVVHGFGIWFGFWR
jgi:hypothetical protein